QKIELVERQPSYASDLFLCVRRGELELMPGVVAKLERCRFDAETLGPFDKTPPIGPASEFSIRDNLYPHALLQCHDVADALILQFFELGVVNLLACVLAICLAQDLWAQQASDMIGAERRTALSEWHATSPDFSIGR